MRRDGSHFWASVVVTALRDESGTLKGFAKVTRDLTERRQAEENTRRLLQEEAARKAAQEAAEEIERQREQLHVTLTSIGDAVIVTDSDGTVTFLNSVAAGLTGWRVQEATGRPLSEVFRTIHEDSRTPLECPFRRMLQTGQVVELEERAVLVTRDGREVPIEDTAAPIRGKGVAVRGAVLVFRDVTEARRAMEDRLYLAAIVESSDDAIIGLTLDGHIASWNAGAERLYGYTAAEVVGKTLSFLAPPDHPDEIPATAERVRMGVPIEHFETVRVRKNGSRVDVSLTVSPVKDASGRVIGASKVARDITTRKEEDRRKSEFLALLAHELRNPLSPLRNGLQVIGLAGDDRESVEQARGLMERQLQHLVRLVDDLLDVSRISRGKLVLRKERILLTAAVGHALEICGHSIEEQGHELIVGLPEDPIYVDADRTRLAQAISNLLSNSAKYSDPGGHIWLTVTRDGPEAIISVRDTGVGIPPDQLARVFEMFMQVEGSLEKSQGGLGVGLAIVRRLVEMHGGTVEAHSEGRGKGSEFVIRLPVALAVVTDQTPREVASQAPTTPRRRVLVVDDNVDAAESLGVMLRLMGNEVQVAHDGEEAMELASLLGPDLVLLDIGMPRLNGYDVARRIRDRPWGKAMTLVALTGWGQEEDRRKSQEAGFDLHMVKPVEPDALERLLAGLERERA
jgi:PAS domain S-box-containing protein